MAFSGKMAQNMMKRYGSPLYVYDGAIIKERCRQLKKAFPGMHLYYACKANTNPEIVRLITKEGFGIETVSPQEVALVRKIGIPASRIAFTCGAIDEKELISIVRQGVRAHLDSLTQVEYFGKHFPGREISVRLNHGIGAGHHAHVVTGGPDSKFAIDTTQIPQLSKLVKKYKLQVIGLHQHIGSGGILKVSTALKAINALLDTARKFPNLKYLDFGGGFGVPYRPGEKGLLIKQLGKKVIRLFAAFTRAYGQKLAMSFEPGRYIVAESGSLLVTVTDVKRNPKKTFIGVNSGMNHLLRPALYDSYHEIENVTHPRNKRERVTIAGNMCESGDVLAKNRLLPGPAIGDILAIRNAGAYGYVMSSHYNLRPRPAEILLTKGVPTLIRRSE